MLFVARDVNAAVITTGDIPLVRTDAFSLSTALRVLANATAFAAVVAIGIQIRADIAAERVVRVRTDTLLRFAYLFRTACSTTPSAVVAIGLNVDTLTVAACKGAIGFIASRSGSLPRSFVALNRVRRVGRCGIADHSGIR